MSNIYGKAWDDYVLRLFPEGQALRKRKLQHPGDEWGSEPFWNAVFEQLFLTYGAANWRRVVEIGPGSGKYTERVLTACADVEVKAFDVSKAFMDVCAARLEAYRDRLSLHLLDGERPQQMLELLEASTWSGSIDAFFAIDTLVHVDLQVAIAYLLTAAATLKPGGKLIMSLADATTDEGFETLLCDIKRFFGKVGQPSAKFEYVDRSLVENVLGRIGFRIDYCGNWVPLGDGQGRDLFVVAVLADMERGRSLTRYLR